MFRLTERRKNVHVQQANWSASVQGCDLWPAEGSVGHWQEVCGGQHYGASGGKCNKYAATSVNEPKKNRKSGLKSKKL